MSSKLFKRLIVAWWLLAVFGTIVALTTERYLLPIDLVNYLDSVANVDPTVLEWVGIGIGFVLLFLTVAASIGLYLLKPWGRWLFLWANILPVFLFPLFGPSILSSSASTVSYVFTLLTGGILFAMYLPPIGDLIEKKGAVDSY